MELHKDIMNINWANKAEIEQNVKEVLADDVNVNTKSSSGMTMAHWASFYGYVEALNLLIACGADLNMKNDMGDNVLDLANNSETVSVIKKPRSKSEDEKTRQEIFNLGIARIEKRQDELLKECRALEKVKRIRRTKSLNKNNHKTRE